MPGVEYGSSGFYKENNCLFMAVFLSYDLPIREILSGGDITNPTLAFRTFHAQRNPGTDGDGPGYAKFHLVLWLEELRKKNLIKNFACDELLCALDNPANFICVETKHKRVGTRLLLFGNTPDSEWLRTGIPRITQECLHPLERVEDKKGNEKVQMIKDLAHVNYAKDSDLALRQGVQMYNEVTGMKYWQKGLAHSTHGCCIAYHPSSSTTKSHWWTETKLVPCIYDNGKRNVNQCTPESLMRTVYNINRVFNLCIELHDDDM